MSVQAAAVRLLVTRRNPLGAVRDALETSLRPESGKVLVPPEAPGIDGRARQDIEVRHGNVSEEESA